MRAAGKNTKSLSQRHHSRPISPRRFWLSRSNAAGHLPLPKSMVAGRFSYLFRRAATVPWSSIAGEAFDRVVLVAKTVCFVHVINNYVCSIALVRGPSMLPTINITGDIVAVERISPRWSLIAVGDIVLLRSPENPMKTVTKRVLGLEGDTVTFLVDPVKGFSSKTVLVPKGHVWVQGDNIYESRDSRQFGPVPYGLIQGRAFCRVWPPESFGSIG